MPEIHIEIRCEGDSFPTAQELALRHAVEDQLATRQVGEVVDAGAGGGVMDIFLDVEDVEIALAQARAIVKELGLAERTSVEAP